MVNDWEGYIIGWHPRQLDFFVSVMGLQMLEVLPIFSFKCLQNQPDGATAPI
jgi:hypothetical protein